MKTKIFVNRESLEQAIQALIRRAEGWVGSGSGECQLYGRFDEDGHVYMFEIHDFAGHNSWVEGRRLVHLATQKWFNWHDHEDLGEWLWSDLAPYGRFEELRKPFIFWLKLNNYYDCEQSERRNVKDNWWRFEEFDSEAWEEIMEEWREVWFQHHIYNAVSEIFDNIYDDPNYEFVVSNDVERALLEI